MTKQGKRRRYGTNGYTEQDNQRVIPVHRLDEVHPSSSLYRVAGNGKIISIRYDTSAWQYVIADQCS